MKLHCTDKGEGHTTLVFLHYFGGAASSWDAVISHLSNEFRCIAIDMPGFGESPAPDSPVSVEQTAAAVKNCIEEIELTNFVVIGHSMGGKIALHLASQKPEGLLSLILIAPSPPIPEPMKEGERENMDAACGDKEAVEKMLRGAIGFPVSNDVFQKEVQNNISVSQTAWHSWPRLGSQEDISSRMKNIDVPVSILCGEKDEKFTEDFLKEEFSHYFSSFTLRQINEAGHLLPVEKPEEVATEIKHILSSFF